MYQEPCVAARNEKKPLADLCRRLQYGKRGTQPKKVLIEQPKIIQDLPRHPDYAWKAGSFWDSQRKTLGYKCGKPGHVFKNC